jgi:hypothetical protein
VHLRIRSNDLCFLIEMNINDVKEDTVYRKQFMCIMSVIMENSLFSFVNY